MSSSTERFAQLKAQYDAKLQARGETQQRQDDAAMAKLDALIAEDPEQKIVRLHAVTSECGTNDPLTDAADDVPAVEAAGTSGVIAQINQANQQDDGDELAKAIDAINQEYFITIEGSKVCVVHEGWDHELGGSKLSYLNQNGFTLLFRDRVVQTGNRVTDVATAWMCDPRRRAYKGGMALLPGMTAPEDVYNLWRGWGVDPVAGKHEKMLEFIRKVICDNDVTTYNYLIGWFARAVQRPELQAEVAVVLKSKGRGTGKGTLGRAFIKLFGSHGKHLLHSRHLKGNFNAHLRTALGVFADEAFFIGDKEGNEVMKGLITEPTFMVEPKGIDAFDVRNRLKILMATNSEWAVPAAADERRYFILEVPETVKQNTEYFKKLNRYLDNGGLAAWLDYLLKYDISGFDIRKPPTTAALIQEKVRSLSTFDAWVFDKLYRGTWSEHGEEWSELLPNNAVIREYEEYCHRKGFKYEDTRGEVIGKRLSKLFPTSEVRRLTLDTRPRQYYRTFPPLDQARDEFEQNALGGDHIAWPAVIDDDSEAWALQQPS